MDKITTSAWSENHSRDVRAASKRRGTRVNCRVPVTIEWNSRAAGSLHFETAFTRVVNFFGCLLVSPQDIDLQQRLRVTNLVTRQQVDAEVVWKGTQRPDGWDLGVKLIEARTDFWGVDF